MKWKEKKKILSVILILNQLKKKLLASKDTNPLFDNKSFTNNIEKAYNIVIKKYINKKDPEDVYL